MTTRRICPYGRASVGEEIAWRYKEYRVNVRVNLRGILDASIIIRKRYVLIVGVFASRHFDKRRGVNGMEISSSWREHRPMANLVGVAVISSTRLRRESSKINLLRMAPKAKPKPHQELTTKSDLSACASYRRLALSASSLSPIVLWRHRAAP